MHQSTPLSWHILYDAGRRPCNINNTDDDDDGDDDDDDDDAAADDDDDADDENDDDLIYKQKYAYDTLHRKQFLEKACRSPGLWITRLWIAPDKRIVNALGSVQRTDEYSRTCAAASACWSHRMCSYQCLTHSHIHHMLYYTLV